MNIPSQQLLSLSVQGRGFLWAIGIFSLCFLGVHLTILAKRGWSAYKTSLKSPPSKPDPPPKQSPPPEPVYYIVERQKRRPKTKYKEPKQITFKR